MSLAGHLSPKSSKISRTLSRSLPPIVGMTKLPRSEVWDKEWEKSKPNDNISLYFFPHKIRYLAKLMHKCSSIKLAYTV